MYTYRYTSHISIHATFIDLILFFHLSQIWNGWAGLLLTFVGPGARIKTNTKSENSRVVGIKKTYRPNGTE
jgi:hypothetical protein